MKYLRLFVLVIALAITLSLVLAACSSPASSPTAEAPAVENTSTVAPADAPSDTPAAAPTESLSAEAAGKAAYGSLRCTRCHGSSAQGGKGPELASLTLTFSEFESIVRNGEDEMPAFDAAKVSDQQLTDIYAWLKAGAP